MPQKPTNQPSSSTEYATANTGPLAQFYPSYLADVLNGSVALGAINPNMVYTANVPMDVMDIPGRIRNDRPTPDEERKVDLLRRRLEGRENADKIPLGRALLNLFGQEGDY